MYILNQMNSLYFYPHKIRFEPMEKRQGGRTRRSAPAYSVPAYDYGEALAPFSKGCFQPSQAPAGESTSRSSEEILRNGTDDDGAPAARSPARAFPGETPGGSCR